MIYSQIYVNFSLGEIKMKGIKKNGQGEKGKLEHWKLAQNSSKQDHSNGTRPSEFIPVKLSFFWSNSLKQVITRLSEMSLNPRPNRLNRRLEA